jgi:hypothetical protein
MPVEIRQIFPNEAQFDASFFQNYCEQLAEDDPDTLEALLEQYEKESLPRGEPYPLALEKARRLASWMKAAKTGEV